MKNNNLILICLVISLSILLACNEPNSGSSNIGNPIPSSITIGKLDNGTSIIQIPLSLFGDSDDALNNASIDIQVNSVEVSSNINPTDYYQSSNQVVSFLINDLISGDFITVIITKNNGTMVSYGAAVSDETDTTASNITAYLAVAYKIHPVLASLHVMLESSDLMDDYLDEEGMSDTSEEVSETLDCNVDGNITHSATVTTTYNEENDISTIDISDNQWTANNCENSITYGSGTTGCEAQPLIDGDLDLSTGATVNEGTVTLYENLVAVDPLDVTLDNESYTLTFDVSYEIDSDSEDYGETYGSLPWTGTVTLDGQDYDMEILIDLFSLYDSEDICG